MAIGLLDLCRFFPVSTGTADFVFSSAVPGCQSPALAGAVNGSTYHYYAVSSDQTQWELGTGVYSSGTLTFPRTTVLYNSAGTGTGTGQSGAGAKTNFVTIPQVAITLAVEDLAPSATIDTTNASNISSGTLALARGGTGNTTESWHYIETLTAANSASLTTSAFTSAFDDYAFVFDNIVPATDSVNFNATVESAASFQATTYLNATALTTAIDLETVSTISNSAGRGYNGTIFFNNVNSTSVNKFMTGRGVFALTGTFVPTSINVAGYWNGGQGAITRVRFQMSSGNISTGTIKVYGLRNN